MNDNEMNMHEIVNFINSFEGEFIINVTFDKKGSKQNGSKKNRQ